ncbi:MAG: hypothetical protein NTZ64_03135 [Polaromonas sp.]|nr:hypothetical protein [Polaromonas sp.]
MRHFVNLKYAAQQHGVGYAASAVEHASQSVADSSSQRGLTLIVLSAMAALMATLVYQVMDSITEGHLLVLWIGLWAVLLMVMTLLTGLAFRIAAALKKPLDSWSHSLAQRRADRRLWALAQQDERVMADLQMAITKNPAQASRAQRAIDSAR